MYPVVPGLTDHQPCGTVDICTYHNNIPSQPHYSDVIMGAIASQITGLTIVCSAVFKRSSKKTSKLRVTGLSAGNSPVTGAFIAQKASNSENVPISWCHHAIINWRPGIICQSLRQNWWVFARSKKLQNWIYFHLVYRIHEMCRFM